MRFTASSVLSFISFVALATATVLPRHANETHSIEHDDDYESPGSGGDYVVLVDDEDERSIEQLIVELGGSMSDIKYVYDNPYFKGFAGSMSKHCAGRLSNFTGIASYDKKTTFWAADVQIRSNVTWGLQRISQSGATGGRARDQTFTYTFDTSLGEGVDIYIVDTGIDVNHIDFEGRATFGWSFDGSDVDGNGHGTHCAGTAASSTFGIASKANLIAVKVLGDDGSGSNDDIIQGLSFVASEHARRKTEPGFRGSIISMSLGSSQVVDVLDRAIAKTIAAGIHVSVAAGNSAVDACTSSPGAGSRNGAVISVGAVDINDVRASFSNFGRCVTTYGPGVQILSTFIDPQDPVNGQQNIINVLSGTSMACPHITGLIASYLSVNPQLVEDPVAMKALIIANSERVNLDPKAGDPSIVATNLGIINNSAPNTPNEVPQQAAPPARRPVRGARRFGRTRV
ncbi:peptidase S8/S53 domain-containing protein [Peziza echinospora]|nr:peptidase S8/S53 domain-containing protein [Peziza echinospora]